jgi:dTDP-4-dehydrorhamnose 3,5-epimerase
MTCITQALSGICVFEPKIFEDDRGLFYESYNQKALASFGITDVFMQENHSVSRKGVQRGMHFQKPPHAQAKLVRVVKGRVFDAVIDIRAGSPTFGQWFGTELSDQNHHIMYVPVGFAHGFYVLEEGSVFVYKVSDRYAPETEGGVVYNDPDVGIEWPFDGDPIVLAKDRAHPRLSNLGDTGFNYSSSHVTP